MLFLLMGKGETSQYAQNWTNFTNKINRDRNEDKNNFTCASYNH